MQGPAPLEGIKVIDFTNVLMGPLCTQVLADNGAEVIKIERPEGDTTRWIGPSRSPGMGPLFLHLNRGKKSIALDLKQERARGVAYAMLRDADVFVHNLRPRVIERLGFGFEAVKAVNPNIVYCGLYGYGQRGPKANEAAYDDLIQGAAGLPALQRRAGTPSPRYVALNVADRMVGLSAAYAIAMALFARSRRPGARRIDVPMFETLATHVLSDHLYGRTFVPPMGGTGYPRLTSHDRRPYATSDGHICAAIYTDRHWQAFLTEVGRAELLNDPRFASITTRTAAVAYTHGLVAEILAGQSTAHWLELCLRLDIPAGPLNDVDDLIDDPQAVASQLVVDVEHPTEGALKTAGNPIRWDGEALGVGHAPLLGEHGDEILAGLGLSEAEIGELKASGVVAAPN